MEIFWISHKNKTFVDHYIEEEYDLSHVLFVMTANYVQDIPYGVKKDRLEVVESFLAIHCLKSWRLLKVFVARYL